MNRWIMTATLIILALLYTAPGISHMFSRSTTQVLSDGTDPAGTPYTYDSMLHAIQQHPSRFFYGSIYSEDLNPEQGAAFWVAWNERLFMLLGSSFLPVEQIHSFLILGLMILNGLAMYGLSRFLGWSRWVGAGLGIALAFSAYTRARAKVHMSMIGLYHLPLTILGLLLVARGKGWKSLVGAALCFLGAVTVVHYYVLTMAFLAPFFLLYLFLQPEARANVKRALGRLVLAALPAVLWLGVSFVKPIPSDVKMQAQASVPKTGETEDGSLHPFLFIYSAHPVDYFTGDISLAGQPTDLNPLRYLLNDRVIRNLTQGNLHERTNGIRWSLWILGILALVFAVKSWNAPAAQVATKRSAGTPGPWFSRSDCLQIFFFTGLGVFCFWLSMDPDTPFSGVGPSGWLHRLVSQVRVTNRAGIFVHFSLLMMTGYVLHSLRDFKFKSKLLLPAVFPALMVIDYPPLIQQLPTAPILPAAQSLIPSEGECGVGLSIPAFTAWTDVAYYHLLQRIRGTRCTMLNGATETDDIRWVMGKFPPRADLINQMMNSPMTADLIQKMVDCVPLSWIMFDPGMPAEWGQTVCQRLGWPYNPEGTCRRPGPGLPFKSWPKDCVRF